MITPRLSSPCGHRWRVGRPDSDGGVLKLLGLELRVPDHSTLTRRG